MFFTKRSLVAALAVGLGLVGCGGNPEAAPEGASASAAKSGGAVIPQKKIEPVVTKTSRLENCVYGALALKQAKNAYMASVGEGEPSADKIPTFGFDPPEPPKPPEPTPAGSGAASATPKSSAAPAAKASAAPAVKTTASPSAKATAAATTTAKATPPAGSAKASASAASPNNAGRAAELKKMGPQLPFSRLIQGCKQAGNAKDFPAAELDPVLKEFMDYAQPLATTLQEASAYYAKEGFKDDSFAKGKEYHKTLTDGFAKLDEQLGKLKAAADKFTAANPIDKSAAEESQKLGDAAMADATALLLAFDTKPVDTAKANEAVKKLEASFGALKAYGEANKDKRDPWATAMVPPISSYLENAKTLAAKDPAEIKPSNITNLISLWDRVQKQSYSALQRKANEGAARGMGPTQRMTKPRMPPNHPQ